MYENGETENQKMMERHSARASRKLEEKTYNK